MIENRNIEIYKFLFLLFVINLLQAIFTPLLGDEAYYWIYSKNLAFGYFDHPPAIALLIKCSDLLFSNELSIRFFTVVLNTLTALLIWKLIPSRNRQITHSELIFFIVLMISPGFNMYGFISTPDAPLLFFFALYLHALNYLIKNNTFKASLLVGIFSALMIYSKYHAAILILITVFSNIEILKKKSIYLGGFISLVLIIPHLLWQYHHDFVTFNYHLFQRTDGSFKINHVTDFFVGSLGILNPLVFILFIYYLFKIKFQVLSENKIYFKMFFGIVIFFFLYSFRSKVEAHWVIAAVIPLSILVHDLYLNYNVHLRKYRYLAYFVLVLIFGLRIFLVLPFDIKSTEIHWEGKSYFEAIEEKAGDKKVVFANSYRRAAKYEFYTGGKSFAMAYYFYRKSQYDIENYDEIFNNETVMFVGYSENSIREKILLKPEDIEYAWLNKLPVFNKVNAVIIDFNSNWKQGENKLKLRIKNNHQYNLDFEDVDLELKLQYVIVNEMGTSSFYPIDINVDDFKANSVLEFASNIDLSSSKKGNYKLMLVMRSKHTLPVQLSNWYEFSIK